MAYALALWIDRSSVAMMHMYDRELLGILSFELTNFLYFFSTFIMGLVGVIVAQR